MYLYDFSKGDNFCDSCLLPRMIKLPNRGLHLRESMFTLRADRYEKEGKK